MATVADHAFTFLAVFRAQHALHRPTQGLPRVSLHGAAQQQKPCTMRYSVCQLRLWESLFTHALDPLAIAIHFLGSLFGPTILQAVAAHTIVNASPIVLLFEQSFNNESLHNAFHECSKEVLVGFLLPLKNKGQTPSASYESPTQRSRPQKDLCTARDGYRCLLTGHYDRNAPSEIIPNHVSVVVDLELAHIIPSSIVERPTVHHFISLFSGATIPAGFLLHSEINRPRNGLLLERNAHIDFSNYRWGISYPAPGVYRPIKILPGRSLSFVPPDGDVNFGAGPSGSEVELPCPDLCNLHLAVGRVLHMSGAGEAIEAFLRDQEELKCAGCWMDGSESAAAALDGALAALGVD